MAEPADRAPAPDPLSLVQRWANTVDIEGEGDDLRTVEGLRRFLVGMVAPDAELTEDDLRRARELRDAVRVLLVANHGGSPGARATETLNRFAAETELELRFSPDGTARLQACCARAVDAAFGRILETLYAAMIDGTFARLKICRMDTCAWAFYDHSKNHSGQWCSMSVCGNRAKARAYRARRRNTA